jgi:hypothetical protein
LAQWEEYWTGVIDLGEIGVTEGQLLGLLLYVVAAFTGTDIYVRNAFTFRGHAVSVGEVVLTVFTLAFVSTAFTNAYRVTKHASKELFRAWIQLLPGEQKEKKKKKGGIRFSLFLSTVFTLTATFLLWIKYSPAKLIVSHPIPLLIAAGTFPRLFLLFNFFGRRVFPCVR